jgi:hypothetical protein
VGSLNALCEAMVWLIYDTVRQLATGEIKM